MIGIVNYGSGNINAIANIYKRLNISASMAATPREILSAEKLILPGVGAFDQTMRRLDESGLRPTLEKMVIENKVPVLGICVGMQIMAESSEEGIRSGLGWIAGHVKRFDASRSRPGLQLPHMGWNDIRLRDQSSLFANLETQARFYFLHSYYFEPSREEAILAETCYGRAFAASVRSENVVGVQFHPEKSHQWGIQLLKNFAEA